MCKLEEIRVFKGDEEVEVLLKCKRLVKQLLKEEERLLERLEKMNKNTKLTRFNIARMKYALGEVDEYPYYEEYFKKND